MIGQKEMLDIILTEAIENSHQKIPMEYIDDKKEIKVKYDLRVVKMPDGSLKWED